MNLVEVQQNLQGIPDDALVKEMQQPSGLAPQYMVLSELQRRKQMRAAAMAQMPTSTVRQDVVGFAEGGEVPKYKTPGWMDGGIGSILGGGLLSPQLLGSIASDDSPLNFGLAPWILRQLGFGKNDAPQPEQTAQPVMQPPMQRGVGTSYGIKGFADRGYVKGGDYYTSDDYDRWLRAREQDPVKKDRTVQVDSHAMGSYQIMPETWNYYASKYPNEFKKVPLKPTEKDVPPLALQRRMNSYIQADNRDSLIRRGYDPNPSNLYIAHWQGAEGGTKLLDYLSKHPTATAEDAFRYARPDAWRTVMRQNKINPKAMLADVFDKVEKDFGHFPAGARVNDNGIRSVTQAETMRDLKNIKWENQETIPTDEEIAAADSVPGGYNDVLREIARMNSVPARSPSPMPEPGQYPPNFGRTAEPDIGPPITGGPGIDPRLVSPTQLPGQKQQLAPWQVIQQQGVKKFSGESGSYVSGSDFLPHWPSDPFQTTDQASDYDWAMSYRDRINRDRAAAGLPPLPEDSGEDFAIAAADAKRAADAAEADFYGTFSAPWRNKSYALRGFDMLGRGITSLYPLSGMAVARAGQGALNGLDLLFGDADKRAAREVARKSGIASRLLKHDQPPLRKGLPSAAPAQTTPPPVPPGGGDTSFDTGASFRRNLEGLRDPSVDSGIAPQERNKERDMWLALGELGARLAAGNSPYFAQNFGPAAQAGLASYRQSQSQYDQDAMERAKLKLQQAQIQEQAYGRQQGTAAKLTEIEGALAGQRLAAEARIQTAGIRALAKAKFGITDAAFDKYLTQARELAMAQGIPVTDALLTVMNLRGQFHVGQDQAEDRSGNDEDATSGWGVN